MGFVLYKLAKGKKPQESWYLPEAKEFHTKYGVIRKEQFSPGRINVTGDDFIIVPSSFSDAYGAMQRNAQIITRKDIGFIIGICALSKESVVVEFGAGSGGATILLAKLCKHVFSYDLSEENIGTVQMNLSKLGVQNVTLTQTDCYDPSKIEEHEAELVLIDLPEPWRAIPGAIKTSRLGAHVVAYTPTILQAHQFTQELPENILHERTVELIDRDWKMLGRALRPVSAPIGHTGFLTLCRRVL